MATAFEGIGERIAATLFSGDSSKVVAATPVEATDGEPSEAHVIDLNGGPCRYRTYEKEIKSAIQCTDSSRTWTLVMGCFG